MTSENDSESIDYDDLRCVSDADALRRLEEYRARRRAEIRANREAQTAQQDPADQKDPSRSQ